MDENGFYTPAKEEELERAYPIDDNNRIVIYKLARPDGEYDYVVVRQFRSWMSHPQHDYPTFKRINDADDYVCINEMKHYVIERATSTGQALSEEDLRLYGIID
jgi:hypothetical protein